MSSITIYTNSPEENGCIDNINDYPVVRVGEENTFTFQTELTQIPASNIETCRFYNNESSYSDLDDLLGGYTSSGLEGLMVGFYDYSRSQLKSQTFAVNQEAIDLPADVGDSVSGTLYILPKTYEYDDYDD